jgi:integrase
MRTFKKSYRTKAGKQEAKRFTIELRDHTEQVRRFQGFADKATSEALGRQIQKLVRYKGAHDLPDSETLRWIESMPPSLKARLIEIGLLDKHKGESGKPLAEHIEAFRAKLKLGFKPKLKSGNSEKHVHTVTRRVERIVKGCKFLFWADINLDAVHDFLTGIDISDGTYNFYIRDFMQFVGWMRKSKRADLAPGGELPTVDFEREPDKRAFTVDEIEKLLQAAHAGPVRERLKGYDRAVLYLIAAETGYRLHEMATLRVGSFDFDDCSVSIVRENAKDRKAATIPLRTKRAKQLKEYFKGRDRDEPAFPMPKFPRGWKMLKTDLESVGISYLDDDGLKGCFHSLRMTFITNLDKTDASIAERMTLARHSMRSNLTLGVYTQVRAYNLKRVVEQLPDLPWPGTQSQAQELKATGTDGRNLGALHGARRVRKHATTCDGMRNSKQQSPTDGNKNAVSSTVGRDRKHNTRLHYPRKNKPNPLQTQALTEPDENHGALSSRLDPDLQAIIDRWPDLSDQSKTIILLAAGVKEVD